MERVVGGMYIEITKNNKNSHENSPYFRRGLPERNRVVKQSSLKLQGARNIMKQLKYLK